jgi:hypothetical protein
MLFLMDEWSVYAGKSIDPLWTGNVEITQVLDCPDATFLPQN